MKPKPPAFQFYADDFLAGTLDLSTEERGAYIVLLCYQWNRGFVPDDDDLIRRIARLTQAFPLAGIKAKFKSKNGKLRNARMEAERAKQTEFRAKQSRNGAKGGRPAKPSLNPDETQPETRLSSPSPSPSPIKDIHTHTGEIPTFDEVKAEAVMRVVPEASAKAFFDHHEGNQLWINQYGRLINWKHKLTVWAVNDRQFKPKNAIHPKAVQQRVNRNVGTANETLAGKYEGLGRVVKVPNTPRP
ncbi:MAG: DUF1376 domain-containing protein [Verrucomicrobiota bacterium]